MLKAHAQDTVEKTERDNSFEGEQILVCCINSHFRIALILKCVLFSGSCFSSLGVCDAVVRKLVLAWVEIKSQLRRQLSPNFCEHQLTDRDRAGERERNYRLPLYPGKPQRLETAQEWMVAQKLVLLCHSVTFHRPVDLIELSSTLPT